MLDKLKSELREIAFMLGDNANRKEIHSKVINCIVLAESVSLTTKRAPQSDRELTDDDEVTKVARRLKMWAKPERQSQYNAQILSTYLRLSNNGARPIDEEQLKSELGEPDWFDTNFVQMRTKSEKNHGKIFDLQSGMVTIWPPVKPHVDEYQNATAKLR